MRVAAERRLARLKSALGAPRDLAALAAFRILFGGLMAFSALRFLANGWVAPTFERPDFFFHYAGFSWLDALPGWGMHAAFWALAALALCVALGLFYRVAIVAFGLLFTYVELIDVTNYLNHYYLVSVLCVWMAFLPLNACWSLDVRRRPGLARQTAPAWMQGVLRAQIGLVYVYAGVAKVTGDWLLHAQPLNLWLAARTETPLIGGLLAEPWAATAFSWAGCLHDLLIVPLLLWRRTRVPAYVVLVAFHVTTGLLFNIGLFPAIMIVAATVFLAPDWPRRLVPPLQAAVPAGVPSSPPRPPWPRLGVLAVALFLAFQALWPLRAFTYGGDVLWHEQGMRFSWRVMVREKNASVTYRVTLADGRDVLAFPHRYLTPQQAREFAGQPDLILQLAHHVAADFAARGYGDVEVRADAWASLNGRPAARLIDPAVDLTRVQDSFAAASWILPGPTAPPPQLRPGATSVAKATP